MEAGGDVESQIDQWRGYVQRRQAIAPSDVDEMEDHLRAHVADLTGAGLTTDEAFLVAVKRMGNLDAISREFAREHADRLWKQLVLMPVNPDEGGLQPARELIAVLALAIGAALTFSAGRFFLEDMVFARNATLLVLPFLVAYFAWKRRLSPRILAALGVPFVVAAVVLNVYPFELQGSTEVLAIIHAPIALWFAVGVAYVGGDWRSDRRRMDFIRFTGECVIYFSLLGLGGGVLMGLTAGILETLELDAELVVAGWILPLGVAGAVIVAAWLVEAKQEVVENIAPVLTRVFTPLTTLMLLALLPVLATRGLLDVDRDLLILMDLVLVLVLGLLLYAISARDAWLAPDRFDRLQLVLVLSALAVDVLMLAAMLTRIAEFGFTANKVAALGLNLVLLVNLAWSARLSFGFVRGDRGFGTLERWQTQYLPAYGVWAAVVVFVLPPIFDFT
jgi:hypothetical protein